MVLHQELGDELVVTCSSRMLSCIHREPAFHEPHACTPVDLRSRSRFYGRELRRRELRQQRVDAVPTAVLEAGHEQVRTLERGQDEAESERESTLSQRSGVKRPRTDADSRKVRASSSSEASTSSLR